MTEPLHKSITAKDGTYFYKQVAAFSYEGFLEKGVGAVIIQEGQFTPHPDGSIHATPSYVPFDPGNQLLPSETVQMINDYNPETEVVLAIVGQNGKATCLTLTAAKIGDSPVGAYMKARKWHVDIQPGSVLRLKAPVAGMDAGYYVFLREEKAMMKLARAGMDDDEGEIIRTEEEVETHVDFVECFERTEINVYHGD